MVIIFFSFNSTCRSCTNPGLVMLQKKDIYCRSCFLVAETHKFRATLGKSKMMKPKDNVLVDFGGNHSSVALIHMLYCGMKEEHHKKILFNCKIIYIDGMNNEL